MEKKYEIYQDWLQKLILDNTPVTCKPVTPIFFIIGTNGKSFKNSVLFQENYFIFYNSFWLIELKKTAIIAHYYLSVV